MFLHVEDVRYMGEYVLRLTFNNGIIKDVDLCSELHGPMFEPLKDKDLFQQVRINPARTTIEWPNGADFAPEFLFETGKEVGMAKDMFAKTK